MHSLFTTNRCRRPSDCSHGLLLVSLVLEATCIHHQLCMDSRASWSAICIQHMLRPTHAQCAGSAQSLLCAIMLLHLWGLDAKVDQHLLRQGASHCAGSERLQAWCRLQPPVLGPGSCCLGQGVLLGQGGACSIQLPTSAGAQAPCCLLSIAVQHQCPRPDAGALLYLCCTHAQQPHYPISPVHAPFLDLASLSCKLKAMQIAMHGEISRCAGRSKQPSVSGQRPGHEASTQPPAAAGLWSSSPDWVTQRLLTLLVLARHLMVCRADSKEPQGLQQAGHLLASLYLKRVKALLPGMAVPRLPLLAEAWLVCLAICDSLMAGVRAGMAAHGHGSSLPDTSPHVTMQAQLQGSLVNVWRQHISAFIRKVQTFFTPSVIH